MIENFIDRYRPARDYVLIKPDPEKTRGGILLPESCQHGYGTLYGTVIRVGPGWTTKAGLVVEPSVKAGDRIAFTVTKFFIDLKKAGVTNEDAFLVQEREILGVRR